MSEKRFIEAKIQRVNDDWYIAVITRCEGITRGAGRVGYTNVCSVNHPYYDPYINKLHAWGNDTLSDSRPFAFRARYIKRFKQTIRDFNGTTEPKTEDGWEVIS